MGMRVGIQEDDQLDDATRAFDDLRAKVAVLRRAVEALAPALKENRSPDYSLSLGQIAKTQAAIGTRLEAIEGHPALRMTPAAFGEQLERAVTNASREARREAEDLVQGISGAYRIERQAAEPRDVHRSPGSRSASSLSAEGAGQRLLGQ